MATTATRPSATDAPTPAAPDQVLRNAVSIALATGLYAVSFGVLSVAAGFSVAQTCVMSVVAFTGASQFTFVSVIGAGRLARAALAPALLLAARNTLYGISLRSVLTGSVAKRALLAQGVIDETSAMAHAQPAPAAKRRAFDLTAVLLFVGWNLGTVGRRARRHRDSATRRTWASTRCSRRCSWRCWRRSCAMRTPAARRWRAGWWRSRWSRSCRRACRSSRPACVAVPFLVAAHRRGRREADA